MTDSATAQFATDKCDLLDYDRFGFSLLVRQIESADIVKSWRPTQKRQALSTREARSRACPPGGEATGLMSLYVASGDLDGYLAQIEKSAIEVALAEHRWNRTAAAKSLGITQRSLRYRLKKLGIDD